MPSISSCSVSSSSMSGRERAKDVEGDPSVRSRRIDRELGRFTQLSDVLAAEVPRSESTRPQRRSVGCELVDRHALAFRLALVDPRPEVRWRQVGEGEHQIRHVALGVEHEGWDAGAQRLLEEYHAQARLPRARHADDDPVGCQVAGVVAHGPPICDPLAGVGIDYPPR